MRFNVDIVTIFPHRSLVSFRRPQMMVFTIRIEHALDVALQRPIATLKPLP